MLTGVYLSQPNKAAVIVQARDGWAAADDQQLLALLKRQVRDALVEDWNLYQRSFPFPTKIDIAGWRKAPVELTTYGYKPIGSGGYGKNYTTLRLSGDYFDVQVKLGYDEQ